MASACVNNIGMSPENFPPKTYQSYGWLSPRISFSREEDTNNTTTSKTTTTKSSSSSAAAAASPAPPPAPAQPLDPPETLGSVDFEFRLDNSITMLPADELFSDGKLMPLQVNTGNTKPCFSSSTSTSVNALTEVIRSPEPGRGPVKSCRRLEMEISGTDPYLFSPKAPRCSSRWKELLGLKKLHQNPKPEKSTTSTALFSSSSSSNSKSLKHFLHRNSKTCNGNTSSSSSSSFSYTLLDHSLSLPLLRDSDCESLSISSRLSLSSSSSSHEHEDLPRLSLDSDKPNTNLNTMQNPGPNPFILNRNQKQNQNPSRMRMVKPRSENGNNNNGTSSTRVGRSPMRRSAGESSEVSISRGVSVDSPRMNSSGKIVFQSLERSSSSPSSFNGGPRYKHRGMERSYSANVRVTPVLNVPVCSLRGSSKSASVFGFGHLFSSSPQKRDGISKGYQHQHQHQQQQQNISSSSRNRSDRG